MECRNNRSRKLGIRIISVAHFPAVIISCGKSVADGQLKGVKFVYLEDGVGKFLRNVNLDLVYYTVSSKSIIITPTTETTTFYNLKSLTRKAM